MISHKHKFIFIHPPRTGGTSIEKALEPYSDDTLKTNYSGYKPANNPAVIYDGDDIKHARLSHFYSLLGDSINKYALFCGTRNPWERLASSYIWHRHDYAKLRSLDVWIRLAFDYVYTKTRPALSYIDVPGLLPKVFFIEYRTLQKDFDECCRTLGLPDIELPHANKTEHDHYSRYYNKYSRDLVRSLFKSDIDFFGYEFEDVYKGPKRPEPKPRRHR